MELWLWIFVVVAAVAVLAIIVDRRRGPAGAVRSDLTMNNRAADQYRGDVHGPWSGGGGDGGGGG